MKSVIKKKKKKRELKIKERKQMSLFLETSDYICCKCYSSYTYGKNICHKVLLYLYAYSTPGLSSGWKVSVTQKEMCLSWSGRESKELWPKFPCVMNPLGAVTHCVWRQTSAVCCGLCCHLVLTKKFSMSWPHSLTLCRYCFLHNVFKKLTCNELRSCRVMDVG